MPYFPGMGYSGDDPNKPPNPLGIASIAPPGAAQGYNDPLTGNAMGTDIWGATPAAPAAPAAPSPWPQDEGLARAMGWTPAPGQAPPGTNMDQGNIDAGNPYTAPRYGPPGMQAPSGTTPDGLHFKDMFSTDPGATSYGAGLYDANMGRDQADAAYKQATEYFGPDFSRDDAALEAKLSNQGFAVGSEGYNNEVERMRRSHDLARTNAALGAVGVGNQQALGLAGIALGARGQDTSAASARYGADAAGASAAHTAQVGQETSMSNAELQAQIAMRNLGLNEDSQSFQQLMQLIASSRGGVPALNYGSPAPLDVTGAYGINQSAANANGAARAAGNAGLYNLGATLLGSYFGR